ncbi:hypothetical protein Moror_8189 [Moniliophthora roreri MCA 2997]|uniref:Uncharacterized protein n=2 Tax=Moniliophthora roreri TaxID=221103 RepID=V2YRN0_MONRO|nr:hypothetical protein Moror_8189 [Moniliophthora roreri MCA 2997]KAI3606308.1 hypothetical protein WG66_009627 [Moniliophthora roreri]
MDSDDDGCNHNISPKKRKVIESSPEPDSSDSDLNYATTPHTTPSKSRSFSHRRKRAKTVEEEFIDEPEQEEAEDDASYSESSSNESWSSEPDDGESGFDQSLRRNGIIEDSSDEESISCQHSTPAQPTEYTTVIDQIVQQSKTDRRFLGHEYLLIPEDNFEWRPGKRNGEVLYERAQDGEFRIAVFWTVGEIDRADWYFHPDGRRSNWWLSRRQFGGDEFAKEVKFEDRNATAYLAEPEDDLLGNLFEQSIAGCESTVKLFKLEDDDANINFPLQEDDRIKLMKPSSVEEDEWRNIGNSWELYQLPTEHPDAEAALQELANDPIKSTKLRPELLRAHDSDDRFIYPANYKQQLRGVTA